MQEKHQAGPGDTRARRNAIAMHDEVSQTYLFDNGKNPRLGIIVAVSANSLRQMKVSLNPLPSPKYGNTHQVDLDRAVVSLESAGQTKQRILGSLGHGICGKVGSRSHGGRDVVCNVVEAVKRSRGRGIRRRRRGSRGSHDGKGKDKR